MEIDLTLKDEDIVMPSNLQIKRWDWTITDLKCNTCCNLMIHLYCDNDEYDENMPLGYCVKNILYVIKDAEYAAWGEQDSYITEIALREINKLSN
jgi:hypothetical protein